MKVKGEQQIVTLGRWIYVIITQESIINTAYNTGEIFLNIHYLFYVIVGSYDPPTKTRDANETMTIPRR